MDLHPLLSSIDPSIGSNDNIAHTTLNEVSTNFPIQIPMGEGRDRVATLVVQV